MMARTIVNAARSVLAMATIAASCEAADAEDYIERLDKATPAAAALIYSKVTAWRTAPAIVKERVGFFIFTTDFPNKKEMSPDDMVKCVDRKAASAPDDWAVQTLINACATEPIAKRDNPNLPSVTAAVLQPKTTAKRSAKDASPTATCIRKGILRAQEILDPGLPSSTQEERDAITANLVEVRKAEAVEVRKCGVTRDDVYQVGWFSFFSDVAIDKCRLKRTAALNSYSEKDNADTDLINGIAAWEPVDGYTADTLNQHPFFRGQSEARSAHRYLMDERTMCRDVFGWFGPNGTRFPGLLR
jgi:hypothetical protein